MNRHQEAILDILMEYKRLCDKYELTYFAIGGTCIGAVRHKGFIPWDDDLDVAMPYADYLRFIEIAKKELREPYELYDFHNNRHAMFKFMKLQNANTTFIEKSIEQFPDRYTGIFIDIMPISGIPKGLIDRKRHLIHLRILNKLDFLKRANGSGMPLSKSMTNRIATLLMFPALIGRKYNKYSYMMDKLWGKYKISKGNDVFFLWRLKLHGHYQNTFPYEIFKDTVDLPFEDTFIKVPIGYDEYLKMDFGDYMKLPPREKQVPVHDYAVLDLDKSYREYIKKYEECGTL